LGAEEMISAHGAIRRDNRALHAASCARSVDDLDTALKMIKA